MRKITGIVLAIVTALLSFTFTTDTEAATIQLNKQMVVLEEGATITLKVTGTDKEVTWESDASKIAKVSSAGKVTAVSEGSAIIIATVDKKKYQCVIAVFSNNKPEPKPYDSEKAAKNTKISECYSIMTDNQGYAFAVVENKSTWDEEVTVTFTFKDKSDNIVDTTSEKILVAAGSKACAITRTSKEFAEVDTHYSVEQLEHYKAAQNLELKIKEDTQSKKVKITFTNRNVTGVNNAKFTILALDKNGKIVNCIDELYGPMKSMESKTYSVDMATIGKYDKLISFTTGLIYGKQAK